MIFIKNKVSLKKLVGKRYHRLIELACIRAIKNNPISPLQLMYAIRMSGIAARYGINAGKIISEKIFLYKKD